MSRNATERGFGNCDGGSSIRKLGAARRRKLRLSKYAVNTPPTMPSKYSPSRTSPCRFKSPKK